jgi:hypothetical protein
MGMEGEIKIFFIEVIRMHYQKISKYKKNNNGNFSLVDYNELYRQTIPLLYSSVNIKKNILLAYTKRITVEKEIIKKS